MAQAMRVKSFVEAVNAAIDPENTNIDAPVKGQTQVLVRTGSEEDVVAEVLVTAEGNLLLVTKEALADIVS